MRMEQEKRIIVVGAGHLSFQIYRKLQEKGYTPQRVVWDPKEKHTIGNGERSVYEAYRELFQQAGIAKADTVYLVDDEDQYNIQFFLIVSSLNQNARLVVSLFNESLAPNLGPGHKTLTVFNPAAIAAKVFVHAVEKHAKETKHRKIAGYDAGAGTSFFESAFFILSAVFVAIFALATVVFHITESLSWVDAVYFTTTVLTTTGFGDISLYHSEPLVKLFGVLLMLVGVTFASIIFSFIVDWLLARRAERALGRMQYRVQGHIILCGLGRLGYQIALELLKRGHKVLVIESSLDNRFADLVRSSGGMVFVADATLSRNLRRANIGHAKALLSVIQNDLKNLEIGLIARSLQQHVPLVLRIFDKDIAHQVQEKLSIPVALSASAITADELMEDI